MTLTFGVIIAGGFILVVLYALRSGRNVRTGLKFLGGTFFFETSDPAQAKPVKAAPEQRLLKPQ